jgi:hypothetical protein
MTDLIQFTQRLPEGGYYWFETTSVFGSKARGLYLTDGLAGGARYRYTQYQPFKDYSALFLTFAATEATPEGILRFANRYGALGIGESIKGRSQADKPWPVWTGEALKVWQGEIVRLSAPVELWRAIEKKDRRALGRWIKWSRNQVSYIDEATIAAKGSTTTGDIWKRFQHGDVIEPGRYYLQTIINKTVDKMAPPRLLWNHGKLDYYTVPRSLLEAMWVQFALAVANAHLDDYQRCSQCPTWFAARTNRDFCSDACRFRAYRERQDEARRLHAKGLSVSRIAKQLKADPKAVKGWIESK